MLKFPSVSSVRHRYNIPNEVSILPRIRVTPNFEAKEGGGGGGGVWEVVVGSVFYRGSF